MRRTGRTPIVISLVARARVLGLVMSVQSIVCSVASTDGGSGKKRCARTVQFQAFSSY